MKAKLVLHPLLAFFPFVALAISAGAQNAPPEVTTAVEGTITDATGAAVAGAKVSLVQRDGGARYEAFTEALGHYQISNPAAGTYTVRAEENGFTAATSEVKVATGEVAVADFQLAIAVRSENIVVTGKTSDVFGDKSGIPVEQFPQSIQAINQENILDRNAISLGDILSAVPSATAGPPRESTYQGFAFRVRGFTAYPVYNGVYQRYFFNVDPSALSNIEEVQVVKGPSSVLLGQGEVGGVMNIVTKRPQKDFAGSVSVIAGSFGQAAGSFDVTGPVRPVDGLFFRATGEIERSGSFVRYLPINRDNGALSVDWDRGRKVAVHFVGEWQERDTFRNPGLPIIGTVISNGVGRIPSSTYLGDPASNGDPGHNNFTATGMLLQVWAPVRLNDGWTLTPRVSYSTFTGIYSEINLNKVLADLVTVSRTGRYDEERHHYPIEQVDLAGTANALRVKHHLLIGMQNNLFRVRYFQQNMPSVSSINTLNPYAAYGTVADGPYPLNQVVFNNYDSWAIYAQDRVDLTERWSVILGVRTDWYLNHHTQAPDFATPPTVLDTSFNHTTYQVGSTYRLSHGWSLFGGYATGFNIESAVNTLTFSGPPLSPEDSWQGEAGLRLTQGRLNLTASVFQINKTNAVTPDPVHTGYSINGGDVRGRGAEIEGNFRIAKGFFAQAGYTYENARVIKSNSGNVGFQVADTPRNRADVFLSYVPHRLPIQIRGGLNFVGSRAFLDTANVIEGPNLLGNNVILPQYTTVDLGAAYTFGRARLDLNVRNIANRVYYLKDFGSFDVIPGTPREVSLRMTYRF
ncbi:MAG TPA: TonB-dependent receptor [Bryobacteraceae bacterium]|nr:TonB-dependent receptor [Bryobacteraceae bacterium]